MGMKWYFVVALIYILISLITSEAEELFMYFWATWAQWISILIPKLI